MKNLGKKQLFVFLLFKHGVILVVALRCQSPQYVILGQQGIIECQFPSQFSTVAWYDSLNLTALPVTKIERQKNGELEVSGAGHDSGEYDISLNGSLIIPSVSIYHDRTFRVLLLDENSISSRTNISLTTTVYPSQTTPAVNLCRTDEPCFVNSMENHILNCTYSGARPAVTLTWNAQSNGRKVIPDLSTATLSDGNNTFTSTSTLDISDLTDNPLTVFTCEASGPALGFQEVGKSVFVYNIKPSRDPSITEITVEVNSSLKLSCRKRGSPTAFVWSFQRRGKSSVLVKSAENEIKIIDNLNETLRVSKDGTLHLTLLDNHLEGIFTCSFFEGEESSVNSTMVTIVDPGGQGFPVVVIVIIVLVIVILLVICIVFFIRKKMQSAESERKYDAIERNPPEERQRESEKSNEDVEEPASLEMESYENVGQESAETPAEESFVKRLREEGIRKKPRNDTLPITEAPLQPSTSEQEHDEKVKDPEDVSADLMEEVPLQSPENEEACPADENEDPENVDPGSPEQETDPSENRTAAGAVLSNRRLIRDHEDRQVDSIRDLVKGDHIVFSGWMLHPRCHGIVVDTNIEKNEIRLVRFTYKKGVVEEWMAWKPPIYKVLTYYIGDKTFSANIYEPESVIKRARSMLHNDTLKYNIGKNNCKTFARWCKTDAKPAGYGYD